MSAIELPLGTKLTNDQLSELFMCSTNGGMRRSLRKNALVIVSSHVKGIYEDKWENDVLYYTGMGLKGDQSLDFQQNKTLNLSRTNGVNVYLFESFIKNEYIFLGEVELIEDAFQEDQLDENNSLRKVWVFPVRVKDSNALIDSSYVNNNYKRKVSALKNKSKQDLLDAARKTGREKVGHRYTKTKSYNRSMDVVALAKKMANGICQLCDQAAPFYDKKNKEPYLETHHIVHLARGGMDIIENAVALCPNCHKKIHILDHPQDVQILLEKNLIMMNNLLMLDESIPTL